MRLIPALLAAALAALPLRAQEVDLELVLLADASGSIDPGEIAFQREGYAAAITDPAVVAAIRSTAYGRIAVTYAEWARDTAVVVPWTVIDGVDSATRFAAALRGRARATHGRNAIGTALLTARDLIEGNAIDGWRKVIDFSGDSAYSYSGPPIAAARAAVLADGITINGLAILCATCSGRAGGPDLEGQYRDRIIGGPGAFVVTADSRESFADAVRRKLILEISGMAPSPGPLAAQ